MNKPNILQKGKALSVPVLLGDILFLVTKQDIRMLSKHPASS